MAKTWPKFLASLGSGYPFTRIPEIPVGYRSTGTDLKPVQIPEIPDLPEIEMDLCDIYGQKQTYGKSFFPSSFFSKVSIIPKMSQCSLVCNWIMGTGILISGLILFTFPIPILPKSTKKYLLPNCI